MYFVKANLNFFYVSAAFSALSLKMDGQLRGLKQQCILSKEGLKLYSNKAMLTVLIPDWEKSSARKNNDIWAKYVQNKRSH